MLQFALTTNILNPQQPQEWQATHNVFLEMSKAGWKPLRETLNDDGVLVIVWYQQVAPETTVDVPDETASE